MNTWTAIAPPNLPMPQRTPAAVRTVFRLLQHLQHGTLNMALPNGSVLSFGDGNGPHVSLSLHNWKPLQAALTSGDIGFAESYIAGDWSTSQLPALLGLLAANRKALDAVIHGSWAGRLIYRLRHLLHRNTKQQSRHNIHAHYDLGNAFYQLWLDSTMNYSSGLFEGDHERDLASAQHAKVQRALRMSGVKAGDRVLEIGCGWGALAEAATHQLGAQLTGVTLSTEQLAWAQARLAALGCAERADLRLQDYRDIADGPYDAICSIEMLEAVGQSYWPTYFERVAALLKSGGRACIQTIVIRNELFDHYIRSTDFIQQYIFPGGCLPSPERFVQQAHSAGLQVVDQYAFGRDYAETCRRWRSAFHAQRETVLQLKKFDQQQSFDERFVRIWDFYLAYCEAGFDAGDIDVVQFTLAK